MRFSFSIKIKNVGLRGSYFGALICMQCSPINITMFNLKTCTRIQLMDAESSYYPKPPCKPRYLHRVHIFMYKEVISILMRRYGLEGQKKAFYWENCSVLEVLWKIYITTSVTNYGGPSIPSLWILGSR